MSPCGINCLKLEVRSFLVWLCSTKIKFSYIDHFYFGSFSWLVSLLNGISTFMSYLMLRLVEERQWYYFTKNTENIYYRVHTFLKGIRPKINVKVRPEFEHAYYEFAVQPLRHGDCPIRFSLDTFWTNLVYISDHIFLRMTIFIYVPSGYGILLSVRSLLQKGVLCVTLNCIRYRGASSEALESME